MGWTLWGEYHCDYNYNILIRTNSGRSYPPPPKNRPAIRPWCLDDFPWPIFIRPTFPRSGRGPERPGGRRKDVQDGTKAARDDNGGGQSIYLGNKLPNCLFPQRKRSACAFIRTHDTGGGATSSPRVTYAVQDLLTSLSLTPTRKYIK